MFHWFPSRPFLKFVALYVALLSPALAQSPDASPEEKKSKPQLRFICVSSLANEQEVIIASKNDNGDWLELGKVELRSSFITDWLPAGAEKLHLALREEGTLKSICQFTYPATARRALVVLIADPQKKIYLADVVDPEKLKFAKGSVLIVNFSSQPGMVVLGSKKLSVNPGQRAVAEPGLDDNGMYRMLVAYHNADKQPVPCYDRYVAGNPRSRNMLFLFPDPTLGLRVFRLPMFGDLD